MCLSEAQCSRIIGTARAGAKKRRQMRRYAARPAPEMAPMYREHRAPILPVFGRRDGLPPVRTMGIGRARLRSFSDLLNGEKSHRRALRQDGRGAAAEVTAKAEKRRRRRLCAPVIAEIRRRVGRYYLTSTAKILSRVVETLKSSGLTLATAENGGLCLKRVTDIAQAAFFGCGTTTYSNENKREAPRSAA